MTPLQLAHALYEQGILCVPTGHNRVPVGAYAHWREGHPPTEEQYFEFWRQWSDSDPQILCGFSLTEDKFPIEAVDVDIKNDPDRKIVELFEAEMKEYAPELFAKLYIEETASGGRHYFYKAEAKPKRVLAQYLDPNAPLDFDEILKDVKKYKIVIEIQGQKSLCRCFPTAGIKVVQGNILELPVLLPHEVSLIEYIASELDQRPPEKIVDEPRKERVLGDKPGNDYSSNVPLSDFCYFLERKGWHVKQRGQRIYLRHPDSTKSDFNADIKGRVFKSYSPNAPQFNVGEPYSLWRVYAILEHGGDFIAAAKALKDMGYGSDFEISVGGQQNLPASAKQKDAGSGEEKEPTIWEKLVATRVTMKNRPKKMDYDIVWRDASRPGGGVYYNIANSQMIMLVSGEQKSRKTSLLTAIVAAGISGEERVGFTFKVNPGEEIVWLDTEQAEMDAFHTARRIAIQSMVPDLPGNVHFYSMVGFDIDERRAQLAMVTDHHPNMKMLVIDGIVDLVRDYNDTKEALAMKETLKRIAKKHNCIVAVVMHVNRSKGQTNGVLGASLEKVCAVNIKVLLNDDETSEVSFPYIRSKRPDAFRFHVIGPNIPEVDGYPKPNYDFSIGDPDWKWTEKWFPDTEPAPEPASPVYNRTEPLTEHELNAVYNGEKDEEDAPF